MKQLKVTKFCAVFSYIFLLSSTILAQTLDKPKYRKYEGFKDGHHQYSSVQTEFPNAGVADDFGPRELPGYDFHSGIDYNGDVLMADGTMDKDVDDLILAVEEGTVSRNTYDDGWFYLTYTIMISIVFEHVLRCTPMEKVDCAAIVLNAQE
jgi:hypothetical protein